MITIHLHIGQPKTGSSSIQRFLKKNKEVLIKHKYLYETGQKPNHQTELTSIFREDNIEQSFISFIQNQVQIANSLKCTNIIISAEALFFMPEKKLQYMLNVVKEKVVIYVYLRRQDLYLESAWKQWYYKDLKYIDFHDYVNKYKIPNYYYHLNKWAKLTSIDNIKVTAYEKQNFKDGLENHFLMSLGVKNTEFFNYTIDDDGWGENKGLTSEGLLLAFLVRELSNNNIHDHSIQYFINKHFKHMKKEHFSNYNLLSLKERKEILKKFKNINNSISNDYLKKNSKLFKDEISQIIEHENSEELENIIKMLKDLVLIGIEQDKLIKKLRKVVLENERKK